MKPALAITACAVHSAWSDNAVSLAAALACGHGAMRLNTIGGDGHDALCFAPIERWQNQALDYSDRLLRMATQLFDNLYHDFADRLDGLTGCCLVLPPEDSLRGEFLDDARLQGLFAHRLGRQIDIHVLREPDSLVASLDLASRDGRKRLVVVLDSLLHAPTLMQLRQQGLLQLGSDADGICPGEAAVALMVEADGGQKSLANIEGLSHHQGTAGLLTSVVTALDQSGWPRDAVDGVFVCGVQTMAGQLDWYEAREGVWQREISEQEHIAMMLGEIDPEETVYPFTEAWPHLVNGDTGIASPALALVMLIGRITAERELARFGLTPAQRMLVCAAGDAPLCVAVSPGPASLPARSHRTSQPARAAS